MSLVVFARTFQLVAIVICQPKIVCGVAVDSYLSAFFSEMLRSASVSASIKSGNEPVV